MTEESRHIVAVTLDEQSFVRRNPDIEHERAAAIHDLLEANRFVPKPEIVGGDSGPYAPTCSGSPSTRQVAHDLPPINR